MDKTTKISTKKKQYNAIQYNTTQHNTTQHKIDQPQIATRSKCRSDNNLATVAEPKLEAVPMREGLRGNRGKYFTWRSSYEDEFQKHIPHK